MPPSFLSPSSVDSGSSDMTVRFCRGPTVYSRDGNPLLPKEPKRGTSGSAGLDLFIAENETLRPGETRVVESHFSFNFPREVYGQLHLRSSACSDGKLLLLGGVIGQSLCAPY
jgi:hypothetical protein